MEGMLKPNTEIGRNTSVIVPTAAKELYELNNNPHYIQQNKHTYNQSAENPTGNNPNVQVTDFGGQSDVYYVQNTGNYYGNDSYGDNNPNQYPEDPYYDYENIQPDGDIFAPSFDTQKIRNKFIRKVYLILSVQLLFFGGLVALFVFEPNVRKTAQRYTLYLYIPAMVVFFISYLVLVCNTKLRKRVPINFILLSVMTFGMALLAATLSAMYESYIVMMAFAVVSGVCLLITAAAWFNIFDMTKYRAYLFVASCVMLVLGIIWIIMSFVIRSPVLTIVYISLMTILFAMYLMYDTQMIIGGKKHKHELSAEEYILGAVLLYVDIAYLFINILMLMGICNR